MIKLIVKSNGENERMEFKDVMNSYAGLIVKIAKKYKGLNLTEDDMQECYLALWKAYSNYDEVHCFSTYATVVVGQHFQNLKNYEVAEMRNSIDREILNMEYDLGDGNQLGDMIADDNCNFEQSIIDKDIISYVKSQLSDMEMDLLAYNFGYVTGVSLAEKYGVRKSAITNRNARFKIKLRKIIEQYNEI